MECSPVVGFVCIFAGRDPSSAGLEAQRIVGERIGVDGDLPRAIWDQRDGFTGGRRDPLRLMSFRAAQPQAHAVEEADGLGGEIEGAFKIGGGFHRAVLRARSFRKIGLERCLLFEKPLDRFAVVGIRPVGFCLFGQVTKMPAHADSGQRVDAAAVNAPGPDRCRIAHPHLHEAARDASGRVQKRDAGSRVDAHGDRKGLQKRGVVPETPAAIVMINGVEEGMRRKTLITPCASQFAGDPRVFGLRDDQPITVIVATDQGSAPVPKECWRRSLNFRRSVLTTDLLQVARRIFPARMLEVQDHQFHVAAACPVDIPIVVG